MHKPLDLANLIRHGYFTGFVTGKHLAVNGDARKVEHLRAEDHWPHYEPLDVAYDRVAADLGIVASMSDVTHERQVEAATKIAHEVAAKMAAPVAQEASRTGNEEQAITGDVGEDKWAAYWYGSDPNKGAHIWTVDHHGKRKQMLCLMGTEHHDLERARFICDLHNRRTAIEKVSLETLNTYNERRGNLAQVNIDKRGTRSAQESRHRHAHVSVWHRRGRTLQFHFQRRKS